MNSRNRTFRIVIGIAAVVIFGWAMLQSGRIAIARIFTKYSTTALNSSPTEAVVAADTSVAMTPRDAEAHYTRGAVAKYMQDSGLALREFEQAVRLRPRDYYLWIELGLARDDAGEQAAALTAFNESMRLAPYYAQPRWLRGNLLIRMGRYDEGFADLRLAAASNPDQLPAFIDLAWNVSRKDAALTEQLVQPQTDKANSEMATFFAKNGKPDEAVVHFKALRVATPEMRRDLIRTLISAGAVRQAFDVWNNGSKFDKASIFDGGFEGTLNLDESGFGWRVTPPQAGVSLSLDTGQPQSGNRSLRINFTGNADPGLELVSQLVVVEPASRYKVNFSIRTKDIVTGGPLVIVVKDVSNKQTLARSVQFPPNTDGWQTFSTGFGTGPESRGIRIAIQREACSSAPCPIFGNLNLDSFSLERVRE